MIKWTEILPVLKRQVPSEKKTNIIANTLHSNDHIGCDCDSCHNIKSPVSELLWHTGRLALVTEGAST